jgi:arsenate reductase
MTESQGNYTAKQVEIAAAAKLLSHPARISILDLLYRSSIPLLSSEIAQHLPLNRTTVFQHLKALKDQLWINSNVNGGQISYSINKKQLKDDSAHLVAFLAMHQEFTESVERSPVETILFLCSGNSIRSQMAEAFFNHYNRSTSYEAISAGIHPAANVHPLAIEVMKEKGILIDTKKTKGPDAFINKKSISLVIFVCSKAEKDCPYLFPLAGKNISRPFENPLETTGSERDKIRAFRRVRDEIEIMILNLLKEIPQE